MKVLLLSPPYKECYMRNARCDYVGISKTQWPPIWICYCGALIEEKGHDVKLIDGLSEGITHSNCLSRIREYKPDFIVAYLSTKSKESDLDFIGKIRREVECKVIAVGPFVSINPESYLKKGIVDYAVNGEFEYPCLELIDGKNEKKIKNLVYFESKRVVKNPMRKLLNTKQLDKMPFVSKFYKNHLNYKFYKTPSQKYPFTDIFTGRGCEWGLCTFCLWVHCYIPGKVYNMRSIKNVIEEIKWIKKEMPFVKEIFFQDDMLPEKRAIEISNALLDENIKVTWSCYAKGSLSLEAMKLMKKAGCNVVHVGYESSSNDILRNVKKGLTKEVMTQFTRDCKKAGLKIHGDFLLGLPGETRKTVLDTIRWSKELDPDTAQFSLINIYPGTPFYDYLEKNSYIKDGEPSYPSVSNTEMRGLAKMAVRNFYLSSRYFKRVIRNPYEYFFLRLGAIVRVVPRMLWKKW